MCCGRRNAASRGKGGAVGGGEPLRVAEQQYQMGDPASGERLKFDFRHASPHLFMLHMSLGLFICFSTFIYAFSAYLNGSADGVRVSISHVIFMGTGMGLNVLLHRRHGLARATRFFAWMTGIWYPMSTLNSVWHVAQAEDHAGLGAQPGMIFSLRDVPHAVQRAHRIPNSRHPRKESGRTCQAMPPVEKDVQAHARTHEDHVADRDPHAVGAAVQISTESVDECRKTDEQTE